MVLLLDVSQVETRFHPFGDSINLKHVTYHTLKNYFGCT
jgi:hypothetical protein